MTDKKIVYEPIKLYKNIIKSLEPELGKNSRFEAEIILEVLFGIKKTDLYLNKKIKVPLKKINKLNNIIKKRIKHYPLQYLLKNINFMGLELKVTPSVFIPRQETELLVENCLKILARKKGPFFGLDIGTGSGNIAIALTKFNPKVKLLATEISKSALKIAKLNAKKHKIIKKIKFLKSNLFEKIKNYKKSFDFIISNPPYISWPELKKIPKEVSFEPKISLNGGANGTKIIEKIIKLSPFYLKKDGFLILEIGAFQRKLLEKILKKEKKIKNFYFLKDYSGFTRFLICEK